MTRNAWSFVFGLGLFGGLLVESVAAQSPTNSALDRNGVRSACEPGGRGGSPRAGRSGNFSNRRTGDAYGDMDNYQRYDSHYGNDSNRGSMRTRQWGSNRSTNGDYGWNTSNRAGSERYSYGDDSFGGNRYHDHSTSRYDYRGDDNESRYDSLHQARRSDNRWSPAY